MTIQPKFHWKFQDRPSATTTVDSISKVKASLFEAKPNGHGRIGRAMHLLEKNSHVSLGKAVGQFGTGDFTIAFGMKNINNHGDGVLDIIGSQTMKGHGNFFSVRLSDKRRIFFHVDENSKGKHYVKVQTDPLSMVYDRTWFHVAVVRKGRTIQIYIDGVLSIEEKSKTGVANIKNDTDVKLGDSRRGTPNAQYEDLRIYDRALNASEIQALIPPINRPLRAGEIELVAADGAAMTLRGDVGHLSRFSQEFQKLRVGPDTAVALFNKAGFSGTSQLLYADLPDIKLSRLKDFPASVRIRSAIGNPFTGKWLIKAPNGKFLSFTNAPLLRRSSKSVLTTSSKRSFNALFKLQQPSKQSRTQLVHDAIKETTAFRVSPEAEAIPLFVEELRPLSGEFAIVNQAKNQWLEMGEKNTFQWTDQEENRAVFARVAKMADKENQVGELAPGEVALYEHVAYHGRTWILSDTETDLSGEYPDLSVFQSLQDETSSIRLGPDTGVTVFREEKFRDSLGNKVVRPIGRPPIIVKREGKQSSVFQKLGEKTKEAAENVREAAENVREAAEASLIEDIVENIPNLSDSQIGDDTISSLKIFRTVEPEDVFASYTTKLSQDYKMVGNKLEEFSAYRTTLRFDPSDSQGNRKVRVEVSATDSTKIEVEGTVYNINEQKSVVLSPNAMNRIMITSEADGLDTPGLKIRTSAMALNERVVIYPNQEAHQQIAELEEGALWKAKDAKGNFIVDREAHSKEEVASVQNTIKRVMATVSYANEGPAEVGPIARGPVIPTKRAASQQGVTRVQSSARVVSAATIDNPWELKFGETRESTVGESKVSPSEWKQLRAVATNGEEEDSSLDIGNLAARSVASRGFGKRIKRIGRRFKNTIKKATSVVIGTVKKVVHVLVKTAEGIIDFVVDTVEKVAEFVEAVVEKVVKKIKQFIEFLQFLFDWGDILDTQRYLKRAVNASLESAKQLAVDAKPHVKAFVDDLQGGVEDGMNQLVTQLGGKPSEVEESGFEMPEALEWFLDKLTGGSKSSDSDATSVSGSDDSPLASFVMQMLEAFEDAIGAGLRVSEGMLDSIQTLIANPREPEAALIVIIEALRDAIIQALEAVEGVALSFLDVVGFAIDLFKDFLNAEIRIPFISDLLDFIGVGKLTVLNLATITLAIPVTITAKLVTGEHLFASSLPVPLDLANQQGTPRAIANVAAARSVRADSTDASSDSDSTDATDEPESIRDLRKDLAFTVITTLADTTNHLIGGILDLFNIPGGLGTSAPGARTFELSSIFLSLMSLSFSYPSAYESSGRDTKEELRERYLWSWRAGMLGLDIALLTINNFERMRRASSGSNIMWTLSSHIEMILSSLYLAAVEEENDRVKRANISNEVFSALPSRLCFLRTMAEFNPEPTTSLLLHLGHAATNGAAANVTIITGGILIAEADKALKDAKAAT